MFSSLSFQLLTLAFSCSFESIVGRGDKEILLSEPQEGQRWLWHSSATWLSTGTPPKLSSCTVGSLEWHILRTPLIRVPPLVTSIEISIKFAVQNCSTYGSNVECSETFDLYKFQQNTSQPNPQRFDDFKEKVKTIRPDSKHITNGKLSQLSNGSSITIPITLNSRGVFLQFEEKSACLALFAVEVTYRVCSKRSVNLVVFEKTLIPDVGSLSDKINGSCAENAIRSQNAHSVLTGICNSSGEWILPPNVSCVCKNGYRLSPDLQRCLELRPNTTVTPNATTVDHAGTFNSTTVIGEITRATQSRHILFTSAVNANQSSVVPSTNRLTSTTALPTSVSTATTFKPLLNTIIALFLFITIFFLI